MEKTVFEFEKNLRERLALSIFSKKKISIFNIRKYQIKPGIRKFEIELFSIIDKLIPESKIEINEAGTIINFLPGLTKKTKVIHKISSLRGISYFIEFILYLLLLNPIRTEIKIEGIRTLNLDISLENIIFVTFPLMRKIGLRDLRIKIFTNFFSLLYNTELLIFSSDFYSETGFSITNSGFLKNLRIVLSSSKNNSFAINNIEKMKDNFQKLSEINKKFFNIKILNKNIFFQTVSLVGESSTGCLLGKDFSSIKKKNTNFWRNKIYQIFCSLFNEIYKGNCIDGQNQIFFFLKMLCLKKTSQTELCVSNLTLASIEFFRDVKKFTGTVYSIESTSKKKPLKIKII
ncbi:rcl1 (nucleomorph) [Hemiselmis andersenii]|uniref:Rcl1 n=1 Tax=Hemiselmis andersenii TaxID=464988 RepID=A9BKW7_HEMAN|nr:rcl1 [Hemiselmis andersenii]ABW98122.1 rcl1 [Hemiselmis andersenii]|mmetsp:Transcript_18349/g.42485  ORF Transcript_18349/g.42485 Transcript_18349/m.42485 type:complete len:346 (-) Transcript_18349:1701-2738(-)